MAPIMQYLAVAISLLVSQSQAAAVGNPNHQDANPTVKIASGIVIGTVSAVSNQPTVTGKVNAYLGVPFASPPVRFAPPTAPKAWKAPLKAQTLPPACLQQFGSGAMAELTKEYFNNPGGYPPPTESEDCLYLNVFTPQDASPKNLKPVMFWIYGGNLQFGTASIAFYNGSSLAVNEDVVVVAINYRTNIFGFSNSPEIPFGSQNSGFLDQRFGLQWVQDNIRSFGGDPCQVTIFGESAGGYSVKQLLSNPPSPLPYRAAIMQSQQTALDGGVENYEQVVANFGCDTAASQIECLRKVPGEDIIKFIDDKGLQFAPVDGDGTFSKDTLTSITSGKFADVPIYIGTNKDEARVFLAELGLNNGIDFVTALDLLTGVNASSIAPKIKAAYPASIANDESALTNRLLSNAIVTAGRQPVWRYFYEASFPNTSPFQPAGAYHSSEIPEVWGTFPLANALGPALPTQKALSKYMQGVWSGFAKDPLKGVPWPKLRSSVLDIGVLGGEENADGEQTVADIAVDYACPVLDPILIASGMGF